MVHWLWVLAALMAGGFGGMLVSAVCVMARCDSGEDEIGRESCKGCGHCKVGCTD